MFLFYLLVQSIVLACFFFIYQHNFATHNNIYNDEDLISLTLIFNEIGEGNEIKLCLSAAESSTLGDGWKTWAME